MGLFNFIFCATLFINFHLKLCSSETGRIRSVHPCFSYTVDTGVKIICSHIESVDELKNAIHAYQNHSIDSLTLQESTFEFLPRDLFQGLAIKHLTISNSNFSRIGNLDEPQFEGLEHSLETLKFKQAFSKDHPLPFLQLQHLAKLVTLEFCDSYLNVLHNRWLKDGPNGLRVVRFVNGNIKAIGHYALHSLPNLGIIDLSENDLNYIPRWAFPQPAIYLTEINLERNKLETLPDDFFTQMPNLAKVNLELNQFSTIDEEIWIKVWQQLDYINIDYNPMICDYKLQWIFEEKLPQEKLIGTCYKPFNLMDRDIHSLRPEELK